MLPIDPDADGSRRAWLTCPNCNQGDGCAECESRRNCDTHWQYLLRNEGTRLLLQCPACTHLWTVDTKADRHATSIPDAGERTREPVVTTIPLGVRVCDIAVSPGNDQLYIATTDSVMAISAFHHVVATIPTGHDVKRLSMSGDGRILYVTDYDGSLTIINTADNTASSVVNSPSTAEVVSPDGKYIYSAHHPMLGEGDSSWISVIDADGTKVAMVPVDSYAADLDVSPDGSRLYVVTRERSSYYQYCSGSVSVIDTDAHTVVDTIEVPVSPSTVTVSPDGSGLYVTHYDTNAVSSIDLARQCATSVSPVDAPLSAAVRPDGTQLYVTCLDALVVVDTVTNLAESVRAGDLPRRLQFSGDGKRAYITDFGHHAVSVIDTISNAVLDTIDVGGDPEAVALSADGERLYVADYWAGTVTVISVASLPRDAEEA
ncbi:MAG: hypothetical protein JWR32_4086 [Mycobacterium sp.]|nr:hypothetical protein [Mycobacterium sp.]